MKNDKTGQDWPATLDLSELAGRHDLRIIVEPKPVSIEVETECKIKQDDAAHRLRKDWLLFRIGLFTWVVLGMLCVGLVVKAPPGLDRSWALATLTAMITGVLGFLYGRGRSTI